MSYLMTSAEICGKAMIIADHHETAYMLGPWGWPANDKMITRATTQGSNAATNKQWLAKANAIKGRGFIFDCVGLIKGHSVGLERGPVQDLRRGRIRLQRRPRL